MDGEAGWWTTSGNIGLPPLAMVMGVGRQQQLGSALPGSLVGESVFRTAKLEILTESASWLSVESVVLEFQSE